MPEKETEEGIPAILARIDERLKNIEGVYTIIHGNGRPGLLERVQKLEDYRQNDDSSLKRYGSFFAWLATFLLALYSTLKHH